MIAVGVCGVGKDWFRNETLFVAREGGACLWFVVVAEGGEEEVEIC